MSKKTPAQRRITYVKELRESLESAEDTDELIGTAKRAIEQLTIAYNLINAYEEVLAKNNLLSKMIISLPCPLTTGSTPIMKTFLRCPSRWV